MQRIIEQTEDGSATLFVPQLNEHYHSVKGARTESQHIFIDMGLNASEALAPRVLEIGFGTGLNAFLTLQETERSRRHVHYTTVELYPLTWQEIEPLHYSDHPLFRTLHEAAWEEEVKITPHFTLRKLQMDVTQASSLTHVNFPHPFDVIYFDAFAPEKQPEMWEEPIFQRIFASLNTSGLLTTYCAKGIIRRMLQDVGFTVERLPGPPGGKREILRGRKE